MADQKKKPVSDPMVESAAEPNAPESAAPVKVQSVSIHRQRIGFLGWSPDKPDLRDRQLEAGKPGAHPPKATLDTDLLPPIRDQGNQGSCTGHATRSCVQYKKWANGEQQLELSPRFIYYNTRLIESTTDVDAGASIRNSIKSVAKLGVCTERLCPYSDKGRSYTQRPNSVAYKEGMSDLVTAYKRVPRLTNGSFNLDLDALRKSIVDGNPVEFGFTVYENFLDEQTARDGIMREPEGGTDGGHAVWIVGYDDTFDFDWTTGGVWCANSWGAEWGAKGPNGERGYFWTPWELLQDWNFADDFWSVDMVRE